MVRHGIGRVDSIGACPELIVVPASVESLDLTADGPANSPAIKLEHLDLDFASLNFRPDVCSPYSTLSWLTPATQSADPGSLPSAPKSPNQGLTGTLYFASEKADEDTLTAWVLDLQSGIRSEMLNAHIGAIASLIYNSI